MIPDLNRKGFLPEGVHTTSGNAFLSKFLFNDYRKGFGGSIINIFDWAKEKHATTVLIGGSFVTNHQEPYDLDCLIIFPHEDAIPHKSEMLTIGSTRIDIQFSAQTDRKIVEAFINLFTHSRGNEPIGIIQINLYGGEEPWKVVFGSDTEEYEIIKRAYINRSFIDHYTPNGVLVSVHGINSDARWNSEIAPIVSSQNWIFAPFLYIDSCTPDLLINKSKAKAILERFREWIYTIHHRYPYNISILAHSFGTYILASYISGFEEFLPVPINTVILTGSIINSDFDWEIHRGVRLARVLNEIAPNDQWTKYMPLINWLNADPLYGDSGSSGFKKQSEILMQMSNNIFDHNNVIKRDVIERHWMPFLMANRGAYNIESQRYIIEKYKDK